MPQSLLDSQFAALEAPGADEDVWECDVRESPTDLVAELVKRASS
jgi:gluconate kinase